MLSEVEITNIDLFSKDIKVALTRMIEDHYRADRMLEILNSELYEPHEADEFVFYKDGSAFNAALNKWYYSKINFDDYYKSAKKQL